MESFAGCSHIVAPAEVPGYRYVELSELSEESRQPARSRYFRPALLGAAAVGLVAALLPSAALVLSARALQASAERQHALTQNLETLVAELKLDQNEDAPKLPDEPQG